MRRPNIRVWMSEFQHWPISYVFVGKGRASPQVYQWHRLAPIVSQSILRYGEIFSCLNYVNDDRVFINTSLATLRDPRTFVAIAYCYPTAEFECENPDILDFSIPVILESVWGPGDGLDSSDLGPHRSVSIRSSRDGRRCIRRTTWRMSPWDTTVRWSASPAGRPDSPNCDRTRMLTKQMLTKQMLTKRMLTKQMLSKQMLSTQWVYNYTYTKNQEKHCFIFMETSECY